MQSSIHSGHSHEYIISPVCATACLKRNMSSLPLKSRSTPRLTCDLKLDTFPICLSDKQYRQMVASSRLYSRLEKARHFLKWRPKNTPVKGNAFDWWQYAIQVHLDIIHKRDEGRNWEYAAQRARDIINYVIIYKEHLRNPATLSAEYKTHKLQMEKELNFEELRSLREIAMGHVALEKAEDNPETDQSSGSVTVQPSESRGQASTPVSTEASSILSDETFLLSTAPASPLSTASVSPSSTAPTSPTPADIDSLPSSQAVSPTQSGEGILQRWFPAWAGWSSYSDIPEKSKDELEDKSESEDSKKSEMEKSSKETEQEKIAKGSLEEEILYVLSDSLENNTFMKRDAVFCKLSFTLKKGTMSLCKSQGNTKTSSELHDKSKKL